ncbi:MAG: hypothetical protein M1816_006858 [Peltula sp. TS41687]|nr:MAG: hypothetical protein M1816_006858 [Peltula sp. TS41687]
MAWQVSLSFFLLLLAFAIAEDIFTYPPNFGAIGDYSPNLAHAVGQRIVLTWEGTSSSDTALSFWLVQDTNAGDCVFQSNAKCKKIADTPNNGSLPWTVSRMGMTNGDIYYISAFYTSIPTNSATDVHFNSHYINITDHSSPSFPSSSSRSSNKSSSSSSSSRRVAPSSSTTIIGDSSSRSGSSSSTTAVARSSAVSKTPTLASPSATASQSSPPGSRRSSSIDKLPLAVGLGLGLPLGLMAVGGMAWLVQHYRKRPLPAPVGNERDGTQVFPKFELHSNPVYQGLEGPVERDRLHELDSGRG